MINITTYDDFEMVKFIGESSRDILPYSPVSSDEFNDMMMSVGWSLVTYDEIETISSVISDYSNSYEIEYGLIFIDSGQTFRKGATPQHFTSICYKLKKLNCTFDIHKMKDDWWLATFTDPRHYKRAYRRISVWYKCDEIEGLIQFIRDMLSKSLNENIQESNQVVTSRRKSYKKVTHDEYDSWRNKRTPQDLTSEDKKFLSDLVNLGNEKQIIDLSVYDYFVKLDLNIKLKRGWATPRTLLIYKFDDDWWGVTSHVYSISEAEDEWICDEFDGVVELFKDWLQKNKPLR